MKEKLIRNSRIETKRYIIDNRYIINKLLLNKRKLNLNPNNSKKI